MTMMMVLVVMIMMMHGAHRFLAECQCLVELLHLLQQLVSAIGCGARLLCDGHSQNVRHVLTLSLSGRCHTSTLFSHAALCRPTLIA